MLGPQVKNNQLDKLVILTVAPSNDAKTVDIFNMNITSAEVHPSMG